MKRIFFPYEYFSSQSSSCRNNSSYFLASLLQDVLTIFTCAPCVHRVSDLNIDAVLVCNWSQPPTRDGAAGEPDPGLRQTITSISDLTDFQGKKGGAPLLIRLSHNDVRIEEIFLGPSIFKRHDDGCGILFRSYNHTVITESMNLRITYLIFLHFD